MPDGGVVPLREKSPLASLQKLSSSSRFAAFGGRGELRSPLHPPLPPPSGYGADSFKGSP